MVLKSVRRMMTEVSVPSMFVTCVLTALCMF